MLYYGSMSPTTGQAGVYGEPVYSLWAPDLLRNFYLLLCGNEALIPPSGYQAALGHTLYTPVCLALETFVQEGLVPDYRGEPGPEGY
jgi:hypothetical protein